MKTIVQKAGVIGKRREKPLIGAQIAQALLETLREMRRREARDTGAARYRKTEEIEAWEDRIRDYVTEWRKAPRDVLALDGETMAALDDACYPHHRRPVNDNGREWQRTFALRAIKAVCQAWVNSDRGERPDYLAVKLREMTEDEKAADLMTARSVTP